MAYQVTLNLHLACEDDGNDVEGIREFIIDSLDSSGVSVEVVEITEI